MLFYSFCFSIYGQTCVRLVTWSYDLWLLGSLRIPITQYPWRWSLWSSVSSLKFVGLLNRGIWPLFGHSINWPDACSGIPMTFHLKTCVQYHTWRGPPSCPFWCICDFTLLGKHESDCGHDLMPLTFEVIVHVGEAILRGPSMYRVRSMYACSSRRQLIFYLTLLTQWPWPLTSYMGLCITHVICFPPANFQFARPCCSRLTAIIIIISLLKTQARVRETDGQTDRWQPTAISALFSHQEHVGGIITTLFKMYILNNVDEQQQLLLLL